MIELRVNGYFWSGWTTARIPFGIEQIANSFTLTITYKIKDNHALPHGIKIGDQCQILVNDAVVITGYIDDVLPTFDAENRSITIEGRDRTGDLVDCSAIYKSGQWKNASLLQILRDLCKPFDINVTMDGPVGEAFKTFSIQEGETVFECIDRACRMRALMPVSNGQGGLHITRAKSGAPVADLIEGSNILAGSGNFSLRERFSVYHIKGQSPGTDSDFDAPETHTQVKATAKDTAVPRYRPLVLLAEEAGTHKTYSQRAKWERNVRRGRSAQATVTTRGWHHANKQRWQANTLVHVQSDSLACDTDLLIAGGTYVVDEAKGIVTDLSLISPLAYELIKSQPTKQTINHQWSGFSR